MIIFIYLFSQSKPTSVNKTVDTRPKSLKLAGMSSSIKDTVAENFPGEYSICIYSNLRYITAILVLIKCTLSVIFV